MRVVEKKLSALRPYRYNPRKNDQAVPAVAESIRLFGFRVPLVVDKSGEIVCGHTRFKAAKELGLASVPCVIADDLTPEQIRAFRLADNRVAELAEWDFDLLSGEMEGLADMGVSLDGLGFDFSFDDPGLGIEVPASNDNPGDTGELTPKPPEEIKSEGRLLHLEIFNPAGVGLYGIPEILPEEWEPWPLAPFSDAASFKDNPASFGLHFFLDDYRFERVWNNPRQYLPQIEKFAFALSPDFSLYLDTPKAVQIWNHYRKHWCAAYWQMNGIKVFPTICWSDESSFAWCFDGEPEEAPVFVSSVGVRNSKKSAKLFLAGYEAMKARLKPSRILHYGKPIKEIASEVEEIEAFQEKFRGLKGS